VNSEADGAPSLPSLTTEELERIPEELRPKVERILVREERFEMTMGPLPPPDMLARYDKIVPGLPERLIRWTEEETFHRRSMQRFGQRSGLAVALAGFGAAVAIAALGDSVAFAFVAGVCAIVGVGGTVAARVLAGRWGTGPARPPDQSEQ